MSVLALDLGTRCGFAMWSSGTIVSGTQDFKPGRFESSAMRMVRFRGWLDQMHAASPITHVVYEEVRRHAGVTAAHTYGGFMNLLLEWCETHGPVPCEAYPVGAIKKFWTGNGAASKDMMMAEARRRRFAPLDDNEADALALLHMVIGSVM